jgi:hypothetical protein
MVKPTQHGRNHIISRVGDCPVAVSFTLAYTGLAWTARNRELLGNPFDNAPMQIGESKNPFLVRFCFILLMMANPSVSINQSSKQVANQGRGNNLDNTQITTSFEFMPARDFQWLSQGSGRDTEPGAAKSVVSFKTMVAMKCLLQFNEMRFVSALESNPQASPTVESSVPLDIAICEQEAKPVSFFFSVNGREESSIKGKPATGIRKTTHNDLGYFQATQNRSFGNSVFVCQSNTGHASVVVTDQSIDGQLNFSHGISSFVLPVLSIDDAQYKRIITNGGNDLT